MGISEKIMEALRAGILLNERLATLIDKVNPDYNGFGGGMYSNDFNMLSLCEKACWTIISIGAIVK
ncbi:MAG: hypothetical protein C4B58_15780 [Deltaproteobacteria bacterium]|nr:MAG: hypothetical protein C4B58_15780 [Deltaproteobacteria bacterium]